MCDFLVCSLFRSRESSHPVAKKVRKIVNSVNLGCLPLPPIPGMARYKRVAHRLAINLRRSVPVLLNIHYYGQALELSLCRNGCAHLSDMCLICPLFRLFVDFAALVWACSFAWCLQHSCMHFFLIKKVCLLPASVLGAAPNPLQLLGLQPSSRKRLS